MQTVASFFYLIILSAALAVAEDEAKYLQDWKPDIDAGSLEAILQIAFKGDQGFMPQQQQNRYGEIMSTVWDSKLLVVYLSLLEKLNPLEKSALEKEQSKWLKTRDETSQDAGESERGGSLESWMRSECFIKMTKDRLNDLNTRMNQKQSQL